MSESSPLSNTSRRLVVAAGAITLGAVTLAMACGSTDDPRAGKPRPGASSSSSGGSSGGGGLDATAPPGAIDCGPAPGKAAPFTKQALLAAAADCASYHACTFQNAATALRTSVHDHAAAPTEATLADVRSAWKAAMAEWSRSELFQFGPAASKVVDKYHGRGLRAFIHPWPDVNRCQIETQVATKGYAQGMTTVLPNARGLDALEYLFFYPGADTACLPASATGQAWDALGPAELAGAKNDYAVAVADNVLAVALELRNVWLTEGEDFKTKLLAHDGYGNDQEALNVVGWSLFYIEKEIKDWKVAGPAGISATPPSAESPYAHVDIDNIRANYAAFRSLYQGCGEGDEGVGFDDWLVAAGHADLAGEIVDALTLAEDVSATFPPFNEASQTQFEELYAAVKPLSDLMKTRLFGSASPLNLKLPAGAASDTD